MSAELRFVGGQSLASMARTVEGLADGTARRRAVGAIATTLRDDIRRAFDTKTSPAGLAWVPPARRQPHPLLVRTGALRSRALRVLLWGGGVRVSLPAYGPWQNDGTRNGHIPARPFLPADPMPAEARARYDLAVLAAIAPR